MPPLPVDSVARPRAKAMFVTAPTYYDLKLATWKYPDGLDGSLYDWDVQMSDVLPATNWVTVLTNVGPDQYVTNALPQAFFRKVGRPKQ